MTTNSEIKKISDSENNIGELNISEQEVAEFVRQRKESLFKWPTKSEIIISRNKKAQELKNEEEEKTKCDIEKLKERVFEALENLKDPHEKNGVWIDIGDVTKEAKKWTIEKLSVYGELKICRLVSKSPTDVQLVKKYELCNTTNTKKYENIVSICVGFDL